MVPGAFPILPTRHRLSRLVLSLRLLSFPLTVTHARTRTHTLHLHSPPPLLYCVQARRFYSYALSSDLLATFPSCRRLYCRTGTVGEGRYLAWVQCVSLGRSITNLSGSSARAVTFVDPCHNQVSAIRYYPSQGLESIHNSWFSATFAEAWRYRQHLARRKRDWANYGKRLNLRSDQSQNRNQEEAQPKPLTLKFFNRRPHRPLRGMLRKV